MIALLPNLGIVILGVVSAFLVRGKSRNETEFFVKSTVISIGVCLTILALTNILYGYSGSEELILFEIYFRVSISVLWLLLIYKAMYGEVKREARRREKEIEALNDVALAVGQSMDLNQILRNALLSVIKIGNFDVGFIYLLNKKKKILELAASYGDIPEDLAKKLSTLRLGQEV